MTAQESPDQHATTSLDWIELQGEGMVYMTSDRFDALNRMVRGLGLVASRHSVAEAGRSTEGEASDPHAIARSASELYRGFLMLSVSGPKDDDTQRALGRLVDAAIDDRFRWMARHDPVLIDEVTNCLLGSEQLHDRRLVLYASSAAFDAHLDRGATAAALRVVQTWLGMAKNDPSEAVRDFTREFVAGEGLIDQVGAQIAAGQSELAPILERLQQIGTLSVNGDAPSTGGSGSGG